MYKDSWATCSSSCVLLFARINPSRIWYLKFILEGHDGLALLSTDDKDEGIVRMAVYRSRYIELVLLLIALADKINTQDSK